MKNILKFFYLVIVFFIGVFSISAYTCEYSDYGVTVEYDEAGTPKVSQTKYENSKTPIVLNWIVNNKSGKINTTNELAVLESDMIGMCPKSIYACAYEYTAKGNIGNSLSPLTYINSSDGYVYASNKSIYLFSSENEMKKNNTLGNLPNGEKVSGNELWDDIKLGYEWATKETTNGWTVVGGIFSSIGTTVYGIAKPVALSKTTMYYTKYKECTTVNYTGGDRLTFNLACPNLNSYVLKFNKSVEEYQKCDGDAVCISQKITTVNENENTLKSYCKSILAEQDFDGGTEQECLQDCLDIGTQIKQAKMKAGLISGNSGECGFSARLLVWLSNILRWIKYILPVIVIVMGILDFIKAIAAGKDDELKKAQGSFTKRLIAAALVFLIPLIVEFVLDKMGFGYDTCGLF